MALSDRIAALAAAIGADIKALIANKVDKVSGKGLSTNDFTTAYKDKLDGLAGAGGVPTWTTATRPTVSEITIGFNTEKGNLEYWNGTEWLDLIDSGMYSLPFGEAMFGDDEASFTGFHD